MMSIPRDLKVQMPGYSGYQKIDAALSEGGPQLSIRVVKQVIGVPVNHYVLMFWQGFFDLVQHVHGVYEQIDRRYYNPVGDSWTPIDLQPGYQLLNGNQALEYVRFRHLDTDIVRESRQQKFILAFRRQASGQIGPTDIPSILDTIAGNLQTDVHSASTIIDLGRFLLGLPKGRIVHTTLDVTLGPSYVYTTPQMIHRSVERFLNPVLAPAPGAPTAPAGSDIGRRVVVENAGDGFRAADRVVAALRSRGIVATSAGNAPAGTLPASVVYYAPGDARIARRLAAVVGLHDVRPASPGALVHVPMALVLGPGFPASHPFPAHRTEHHRTHAAAAAAVVRDAAPARAAAQLRGVGLRVEAPTVRSPLSRLAPLTPVRAYRIAKRGGGGSWPALNVSFEDGPSVLGRFWDVEETTMPDPPIMDDATGGLRRGGRSYRIVYDGGHVYVVGFHEHGAWYWVTNTLDDSLTAGQMLRIAEGVRPVRHA